MAGQLKLTPFGELVNKYGVTTDINFWGDLLDEVNKVSKEDGDWEFIVQERVNGMKEFAKLFSEGAFENMGSL